jgi:ABC-2 type transport system permease protein
MIATRLPALLLKEARQVVRDPSSVLIAFILPALLLFLFGYGVNLDANRLRISVVLEDTGPAARELADAFRRSRSFDTAIVLHRRPALEALARGEVRSVVVIPQGFGADLAQDPPRHAVQVLADGSEPNTAGILQNYAAGVGRAWAAQRLASGEAARPPPPLSLVPRIWFNAGQRSRDVLVPGSMAVILTIIGTLLTALVVAREWERGTMEALLSTPVTRAEILAAKLLPYFALGMASAGLCATLAVWLFGVPMRGSPLALAVVTAAFLMPALGQGLLISAAARDQFVASQIALFSGFLPAMLLSGFIFEVASMPAPIRWLSEIVPAKHFVSALRTVFLAGDVWELLWPAIWRMAALGVVLLSLAALNLRKRLD